MTLVVIDNAWETTTSTGPTTFTLAGAVSGSQSMAGVGNTNTSYFRISDQSGTNWTVVLATYSTTGPTLTVVSTYASSNSNNAVTFGAGTKNVWCVGPAESTVLAAPYAYPAIKPTLNLDFANSATVDPRITFVRNSTATYYDGKTTAMAEQNLLLYSNTFSNAAWVATNGTVASGVTDPAGTTTAFSFTATGATATLYQTLTTTATPYTLSFYIQRVTGTGAVNLTLDGTTLTAQTITGSWARYSVTATPTAASHTIGLQLAVSGDVVNIFSSQLENRSSVTAANITTTAAITNYIPVLMTAPAGVPRLDYDPTTGQALGLLIEEARTNLLTYSQDFSNAAWGNSNITLTSAANVAPDGTQTAFNLIPTITSGLHYMVQGSSVITTGTYTMSLYAKPNGTYKYLCLEVYFDNHANRYAVVFDCSNGTFSYTNGVQGTATNGSYTAKACGNGYYRLSVTATSGVMSAGVGTRISAPGDSNYSEGSVYSGNGYNGVYIWGAQLEAGSFATSYTATTSATVTRTADQASMTGTNFSSWWNVSQCTFVVEFDKPNLTNVGTLINVYGGSTTSSIEVDSIANGANQFVLRQPSGTFPNSIGSSSLSSNKFAVSFGANLFSPYDGIGAINGASGNFGTGAFIPNTNLNSLYIGYRASFNNQWLNGHIRKINYYATALPSANLQALTS